MQFILDVMIFSGRRSQQPIYQLIVGEHAYISVIEKPGLGIEINEKVLEEITVFQDVVW